MRLISYRARHSHALQRVLVTEPSLCRVCDGRKRVTVGASTVVVNPGEWVVMPAHVPLSVSNEVGPRGYLAQVLSFPQMLVADFFRIHGQAVCKPLESVRSVGHVSASARLDGAWWRLLNSIEQGEVSVLQRHLLTEVFLLLGLADGLDVLRVAHAGALTERVRHLLSTNLAADWRQEEVADCFHMSVATLRRRLTQESTSFKDILDDLRMSDALHRLQTSYDPVSMVAQACGYQSPSRFAQRFQSRFGLTPTALKKAMVA